MISQLARLKPLSLTAIPDTKIARQAALDHAIALARQLVQENRRLHNSYGITIKLGINGLRHAKQLTADIRTAALLYHLPEVLEQAIYVKSERPDARKQQAKPNIVAYHKLALPILYQKQSALAILHLEQDDKGNVYYQGEIAKIAKPAGISMSDVTPNVRVHGLQQASIADYILSFLKNKQELSYVATFAPTIAPLTKSAPLILFFRSG